MPGFHQRRARLALCWFRGIRSADALLRVAIDAGGLDLHEQGVDRTHPVLLCLFRKGEAGRSWDFLHMSGNCRDSTSLTASSSVELAAASAGLVDVARPCVIAVVGQEPTAPMQIEQPCPQMVFLAGVYGLGQCMADGIAAYVDAVSVRTVDGHAATGANRSGRNT